MTYEEEQELRFQVRECYRMLREIIAYINMKEAQSETENANDFMRNIFISHYSVKCYVRFLENLPYDR